MVMSGNSFEPVSTISKESRASIGTVLEKDCTQMCEDIVSSAENKNQQSKR